jgi:hypothetical protein
MHLPSGEKHRYNEHKSCNVRLGKVVEVVEEKRSVGGIKIKQIKAPRQARTIVAEVTIFLPDPPSTELMRRAINICTTGPAAACVSKWRPGVPLRIVALGR